MPGSTAQRPRTESVAPRFSGCRRQMSPQSRTWSHQGSDVAAGGRGGGPAVPPGDGQRVLCCPLVVSPRWSRFTVQSMSPAVGWPETDVDSSESGMALEALNNAVLTGGVTLHFASNTDTIRDAILTCARKPTWVGFIYRTETTTKIVKQEN